MSPPGNLQLWDEVRVVCSYKRKYPLNFESWSFRVVILCFVFFNPVISMKLPLVCIQEIVNTKM